MADAATTTEKAAAGAAAGGFNFKAVLQQLVQRGASDLHLKVGRPPTLRLHGELTPLDMPALRPEDLKALAEQLMTPRQVKEFTDNKECDFAIGVPGIGRFRCNVYQQRGSLCYAMRAIPYQARTLDGAEPAEGARGDRAEAARPRARHRASRARARPRRSPR